MDEPWIKSLFLAAHKHCAFGKFRNLHSSSSFFHWSVSKGHTIQQLLKQQFPGSVLCSLFSYMLSHISVLSIGTSIISLWQVKKCTRQYRWLLVYYNNKETLQLGNSNIVPHKNIPCLNTAQSLKYMKHKLSPHKTERPGDQWPFHAPSLVSNTSGKLLSSWKTNSLLELHTTCHVPSQNGHYFTTKNNGSYIWQVLSSQLGGVHSLMS